MRVTAATAGGRADVSTEAPMRLLVPALALFVLSQVFAGVYRWSLDSVGLSALTYAPTALLLASVGAVATARMRRGAVPARGLLLCLLLCLGVLVGALSVAPKQAVFGLWILIPLIFGYACLHRDWLEAPACGAVAVPLLLLACAGVILDQWLDYPWTGASFELGGKSIAASREWHISERPRLAGFSRSSFDAAAHVAVFAVLAAIHTAGRLRRACLWALAVYGIYCTTSRGILLALIVVMAVVEAPTGLRRAAALLATLGGLLFALVPPTLAAMFDLSQTARLQMRSSHGSFLDRMSEMWPAAYELLWSGPLPVLGRGIGGIGAAQGLFEPDAFNAGDNLFVYTLVMFGLLATPLALALATAAIRAARRAGEGRAALTAACLHLLVLWYGAVSNIVENPLPAAILGLLLASALAHRRSDDSTGERPHHATEIA